MTKDRLLEMAWAHQVLELAGWNVRPGAESEEVGSGDQ